MSTSSFRDIPNCILCRNPFNDNNRCPCTQSCQHSICLECIEDTKDLQTKTCKCPIDDMELCLSRIVNKPLVIFISDYNNIQDIKRAPQPSKVAAYNKVEHHLVEFANLLRDGSYVSNMSPQIKKRLLHLIESTFYHDDGKLEFVRRLSSVFNRLLFELIQSHYHTKNREQDLLRLIKSKRCIVMPNLTDAVIDLLIKLYKAAGQCADTSFERDVLIKFLLKELDRKVYCNENQVRRVVQTLYWSSCFHVTKRDGSPARFKLKQDLCNAMDLRQQHDQELIKLAQSNHIRLTPESWSYLLYQNLFPDNISRVQSLLDKHQTHVTVAELEASIGKRGDIYGIRPILSELKQIQECIEKFLSQPLVATEIGVIGDIMERMLQFKHLFILRQCRGQLSD